MDPYPSSNLTFQQGSFHQLGCDEGKLGAEGGDEVGRRTQREESAVGGAQESALILFGDCEVRLEDGEDSVGVGKIYRVVKKIVFDQLLFALFLLNSPSMGRFPCRNLRHESEAPSKEESYTALRQVYFVHEPLSFQSGFSLP